MQVFLLSLLWPLLILRATAPPPAITALAFSPDGQLLLAAQRGQAVLLEVESGDILAQLPIAESKVTAVAWRRDGKQFAVASGNPGQSGVVRLYSQPPTAPPTTIAAHKDLIHALSFSPDGQLLATGSYDRLVKLWKTADGTAARTLKDHSDAVYGVAFSPDGQRLASVAADRAVKVWETTTGQRLYTLGESTDWLYAVAWSPDGNRLAAGGVDKSIRVWEVGATAGKLVQSAFAHERAILHLGYSADGQTLFSLGEDRVVKEWEAARLVERRSLPAQPEAVLGFAVRPARGQRPVEIALGRFDGKLLLIEPPTGRPRLEPLPAAFPFVPAQELANSPSSAQNIPLPAALTGVLEKPGDVDYFRAVLPSSGEMGVQLRPVKNSKLEAYLELWDAQGNLVAASGNGVLGWRGAGGTAVTLAIRDRSFRGGSDYRYRLHVGPVPVITAVFPLSIERGKETAIRVAGVHLGQPEQVVPVKSDAPAGTLVPLPLPVPPVNPKTVVVSDLPHVFAAESPTPLPVPGVGQGVLAKPGQAALWTITAQSGQRLVIEVEADRLGTPLDSVIEVLDAAGRPVPRAVLRSVAKTYITLRDHDSMTPGIRLEAWPELTINDFLYVNTELMRIRAMPFNADDDMKFHARGGRRRTYLDTTATTHALGSTVYKVELHPPDRTFPPNGFPTFTLTYRNDDGGPGLGKDSRLIFEPPASGSYQLRLSDSQERGGPDFAYRLIVRPARPGMSLRVSPTQPAPVRGQAVPLTLTAERLDGYEGPIQIRFAQLPPGITAPATTIPAEETETAVPLAAASDAPPSTEPFTVVGTAWIDGQEVRAEAKVGPVKLAEPGDLLTMVPQSEIRLVPGGQAKVVVKIERRNQFNGRVPVEVRGLPTGVHVLDVGLNGILILPGTTERTFVLQAEPWVEPQQRPLVVLARREGKSAEPAAPGVTLIIERPAVPSSVAAP